MVNEDYGYTVKQTYLYLRMSLVGTIVAIFLAVALTPQDLRPPGQEILPSISHYYYSPARIVFVGALCAAALALIVLAGTGVQSYLLDIAAMLAPLIALIPTPVKLNEIGTFDPKCENANDQCIPPGDFEYMRLGFTAWFILAGLVIVVGVVRAALVRGKAEPLLWWTLGVAAVVWGVFGIAGFGLQSWFHSNAHFVSAGAFFILVSLVAWIEAIRQVRRSPDSEGDNRRRRAYIVAYGAIGIVLFVNIVAAAVIILVQRGSNPGFAPIGVFVVEVIGLTLFAAFFALQTFDHRHDGDGWGALPPSRKERRRFQPAI